MSNNLAPFGFSQIGVLDGVSANFGNSTRLIAKANATPVYSGDPVTTLGSGYITQSTAGSTQIHGIFIGCKYLSVTRGITFWSKYWPGSDAAADIEAYVISNPMTTFVVQANGQLLQSHVGQNANFALGTGSTLNGLSGATLDVSTIATTNTLPFRIVSLITAPLGQNGTDQTSPYGFAVVAFNNQDFKSLTGI